MSLSPHQKSLIRLLQVCELEENQIMAVGLILQEDEQIEELAKWIDENPLVSPTEIVRKAVEINPD